MSIERVKVKSGEIKWEVYFCTGGRGSKRVRRRFDKRTDAESFLYEFKARKQQMMNSDLEIPDFEETTFKAEADHWLKVNRNRFSPGYCYRVEGILKSLMPKIGSMKPNRLHAGFLTSLQTEMLNSELEPATVNRKIDVITSVLNFSVSQQRLPYSPCRGFQKMKEVRDDVQFWEKEEAISFLSFANRKYFPDSKKRWVFGVYLLALNAGPRAGEIWGLKPKDIIRDGELIHVQRQFDILEKVFRPTKGKENRRIPCNAQLSLELNALIDSNQIPSDKTIFQASNGNPICHNNFIHRIFKIDLEEWGGKAIRFHDLRHSAITLMISTGINLKTVQDIAGHKDIKTTINYTHLVAENIKLAARSFSLSPSSEEGPNGPTGHQLRLVHSS